MPDARAAARELAADRRRLRRFDAGVPELRVLELGDSTVFWCPALGVVEDAAGDQATTEARFLRAVRAAADRVEPATAPEDSVATALAVHRATDGDLRRWIRPLDPAGR